MKNDSKYTYTRIDNDSIKIIGYYGKDEIVKIPEKMKGLQVKEIAELAFFMNCTVKEIIVPSGVTLINNRAFKECRQLEEVTLPDTIRKISFNAFDNCDSFTTIRFKGTEKQWNKITMINRNNLFGTRIKFDGPSRLSEFLNNCKDADEIRKEEN